MEGGREGDILGLEVTIDLQPVIVRKPRLGLVVAIPKVVTVAGGREGESQRVVGRVAAPVRGPVERGRALGVAVDVELRERDAEEVPVRRLLDGLGAAEEGAGAGLVALAAGPGPGGRGEEGGEGEGGEELHIDEDGQTRWNS